ncbi:MarR family winged helix-turn-helix transcriptional regulator [Arthrobacter antioxidans]|uniref:MarR family winged helix-turn-helix transcriptional regulator n=1 Tax=Arthrobacter antioxidans TaxID=2895818 RepID=UPI00200051AB|nr:MarR family winged helix-turn-helix transcriptional regulator [Arthrobacter antioxidans]
MEGVRDAGREEVLAEAIDAMAALTRELAAAGSYPFRERRLGRAQMTLLYRLSRTDGLGAGALAAVLGITPGAVSQHVDHLRQAGLVTVEVDPLDARARIVTLTGKARAEVHEFQRGWIDAIAPRFDALSTDDVRDLRRLLSLVRPSDGTTP